MTHSNLPGPLSSNLPHPADHQTNRPDEEADSRGDDRALPMERASQESALDWVSHESTHRENGKRQAHTEAAKLY